MARSSAAAKSGGTSRIRFVMLEAELTDADLTQVTLAIQNALRPTTMIQHRAIPGQPPVTSSSDSDENLNSGLDAGETESVPQPPSTEQRRVLRDGKPPKRRSPQVIELDLNSAPALSDYVRSRKIESDIDRYLTVAAWFKECRKINEITMDHAYTCFRVLHWPTDNPDFSKPLRNLKQNQLMTLAGRGLYAINHVGLDRVTKLAKE
jgi:hypothetical protein